MPAGLLRADAEGLADEIRRRFPGSLGIYGFEALPGEPAEIDWDLMVVDHPQGTVVPQTYARHRDIHIHLHLRRPWLYTHSLDPLLLTPWGRVRLATNEDAWELRGATILADPRGVLAATRERVTEVLRRRDLGRARVMMTLARMNGVERRLAGLARVTKPAERARLALQFARTLFALGSRDDYAGMIGLALRLASQLAGGQVLRWRLHGEALRGARLAVPQVDLRSAIAQAAGLDGLTGDEARIVARRSLDLVRTEAGRGGRQVPNTTSISLDRCRRMIEAGEAGEASAALVLLKGQAARWLGQSPAYLELCGLPPEGPGHDPAAAWPQLLAVLSTWLMVAQALRAAATASLTAPPGAE